VLLTPLVFAPVAGFLTAWVAKNFPGLPPIDPAHVTALFAAGSLSALTMGYKFVHGSQQDEKFQHEQKMKGVHPDQQLEEANAHDIAESDMDPPDAPERRKRIVAAE
jgi:hypothetical protein